MPFADINGANIFFTDEGSGVPLLLVHGTSCDSFDWNYQIPSLMDHYRVIALDRRGHGHSSVTEDGYGPQSEAGDLAALLDLLGVGQVVAVGHSTGAGVVAALAVQHPDRVRAIVAVDPSYGISPAARGSFGEVCESLAGPQGHEFLRNMFVPFYTGASPAHLQSWHARRLYSVPRQVLAALTAATTLGDDQFFFRPQSEAYLQRVGCPALTVRRPPEGAVSAAEWDRAQFSHGYSASVAWGNAGHWLHQERPEEFNRILVGWVDGLPSS